MKISLNGEIYLPQCSNVRELVSELSLHENAVLVEHNGIALHRDEWATTALSENDRVEILRVVAGG